MRHPLDTAVISGALWLLAAMLIDALTPKELTAYMIGAVLAPAVIIGALFYHLRLPRTDLAIVLTTLWLISVMMIEWITPKPLSPYLIAIAVAPSILVGGWLHTAKWRQRAGTSERKSA
jgi:hypothetical protein